MCHNLYLKNMDVIRFILLTWPADADIKNPVIVRNHLIHQTPEVRQQYGFIFHNDCDRTTSSVCMYTCMKIIDNA